MPACAHPKWHFFSPFQQLPSHSCRFPTRLCLQREDAGRVGCSAAGRGQEAGDVWDSPAPRQRRRGDADQPGCDTHGGAGPAGKPEARGRLPAPRQGGLSPGTSPPVGRDPPPPCTLQTLPNPTRGNMPRQTSGVEVMLRGMAAGLSPTASISAGCVPLCLPRLCWLLSRRARPCKHRRLHGCVTCVHCIIFQRK